MRHKKTKASRVFEYEFTVIGAGLFPIDMLRYDQAYPLDEGQVNQIERSHEFPCSGPYIVTLRTVKSCEGGPTIARWNSRCWYVVEWDGYDISLSSGQQIGPKLNEFVSEWRERQKERITGRPYAEEVKP